MGQHHALGISRRAAGVGEDRYVVRHVNRGVALVGVAEHHGDGVDDIVRGSCSPRTMIRLMLVLSAMASRASGRNRGIVNSHVAPESSIWWRNSRAV